MVAVVEWECDHVVILELDLQNGTGTDQSFVMEYHVTEEVGEGEGVEGVEGKEGPLCF